MIAVDVDGQGMKMHPQKPLDMVMSMGTRLPRFRTSFTEADAALNNQIFQLVQLLWVGKREQIVPTSQTFALNVVQLFLHVCEHLRLNFSS